MQVRHLGKLLGPGVSFLEIFPNLPDKKGHLGFLLEMYLPKTLFWRTPEDR